MPRPLHGLLAGWYSPDGMDGATRDAHRPTPTRAAASSTRRIDRRRRRQRRLGAVPTTGTASTTTGARGSRAAPAASRRRRRSATRLKVDGATPRVAGDHVPRLGDGTAAHVRRPCRRHGDRDRIHCRSSPRELIDLEHPVPASLTRGKSSDDRHATARTRARRPAPCLRGPDDYSALSGDASGRRQLIPVP